MKTSTSWFKRLVSSDNRKAQRLKSPLLVAYYWDGATPMAHEIENISSTGFYLLTKERWHPGTVVTITLQRTDIADASANPEGYITVLSKVIRMGEDGVGFEIVSLPVKSFGTEQGRTSGQVGKEAFGRFMEQLK